MENKETTVRETHYEYDENEKLTSMTINETITNPIIDSCDEGELLSSEVEVVSGVTETLAITALALATVSLCLTAASTIFKHR